VQDKLVHYNASVVDSKIEKYVSVKWREYFMYFMQGKYLNAVFYKKLRTWNNFRGDKKYKLTITIFHFDHFRSKGGSKFLGEL
jgi:hypothetical protein